MVLEVGSTASADALFAWCSERLPPYKCPRYLEIVTDLPTTENHKVAKTRLPRERTAGETDRQEARRG